MSDIAKVWTPLCASILDCNAWEYTNAEMAAAIERQTGLRFSVFTISRYRAAAGLPHPRPVGRIRALRFWRPIEAAA